MAKKLELINGLPRMTDESGTPTIYDDYISIVASGASGPNELNGPIIAGTSVTLPNSGTYAGDNLEIRLNDIRLEDVEDYMYVGSGARTQVQFTFELLPQDRLRFRVDRGA
jgi:hypothetical protein